MNKPRMADRAEFREAHEIPTAIEAWDSGSTVNDIPRTRGLTSTIVRNIDSERRKNGSSNNFTSNIPGLVKESHNSANGGETEKDLDVLEQILKTNEEIEKQIYDMRCQIREAKEEMQEEMNAMKEKINSMEPVKSDVSSIKNHLRFLYGNRF